MVLHLDLASVLGESLRRRVLPFSLVVSLDLVSDCVARCCWGWANSISKHLQWDVFRSWCKRPRSSTSISHGRWAPWLSTWRSSSMDGIFPPSWAMGTRKHGDGYGRGTYACHGCACRSTHGCWRPWAFPLGFRYAHGTSWAWLWHVPRRAIWATTCCKVLFQLV